MNIGLKKKFKKTAQRGIGCAMIEIIKLNIECLDTKMLGCTVIFFLPELVGFN